MSRIPCYIAAPYADEDPAVQDWNVARACAIARLAVAEGRAPIVVHPGLASIYGAVESPETRAVGMDVDLALVRLVAQTVRGELWVLTRDDGSMSHGTRQEVVEWNRERCGCGIHRMGSWADYRQAFRAAGLDALWLSLEQPPVSEADNNIPFSALSLENS